MKTIVYKVKNGLYVNITNRCPSHCVFCLRNGKDGVYGSDPLWLSEEPSIEEIKEAIASQDISAFEEIVFCGFGEPTERLEDVLVVAAWIKEKYSIPIRINTNGLSDLIHGKNTAPMFQGLIDSVSISLNTPDKKKYYELTQNDFGLDSFDALLEFAKNVKKYVPHVILTTVSTTLTPQEEEECRRISEELGVEYRIRPWED